MIEKCNIALNVHFCTYLCSHPTQLLSIFSMHTHNHDMPQLI